MAGLGAELGERRGIASPKRLLRPAVQLGRRLVWESRASSLIVRASEAGLRHPTTVMAPTEVHRVLGAFEAAGIQTPVAGGWGVDALFGRVSRRHQDLDVLVDGGRKAASEVMAGLGYRPVDRRDVPGLWMPKMTQFDDGLGHQVELGHLDRVLVLRALGTTDDDHAAAEALLFSRGTIAGRPVTCLSPLLQLLVHAGYRLRGTDRFDASRLRRAFPEAASALSHNALAKQGAALVFHANAEEQHRRAVKRWESDGGLNSGRERPEFAAPVADFGWWRD